MTTPPARKVLLIAGARPNFMKIAPLVRAFAARADAFDARIVHTGQHYDPEMSDVFFDELGIPQPHFRLDVGSGTHAQQTARVMTAFEGVCVAERPDLVLVVGDVNSTMGAAIVASKLLIPVGHIEAGLRSRDWTMPEEVNRVVTDVVSDLLLTPSADADENLLKEGREAKRIVRVGNVMIDTLFMNLERARKLDMPGTLLLKHGEYAVLTLHRPSNVDDPETFNKILTALLEIQTKLPIVFPVHPRTRARMRESGIGVKLEGAHNMTLIDPLGYLEFMSLTTRAKMVLTDSGGLQEETTALGIPCLTLRENTERPITVDEGTNVVVGTDPDRIITESLKILRGEGKAGRIPELWDGKASERIAAAVISYCAERGI
jgi:UDP-N-acetylglucosamine 2-epimerase (non-hydrolysing)